MVLQEFRTFNDYKYHIPTIFLNNLLFVGIIVSFQYVDILLQIHYYKRGKQLNVLLVCNACIKAKMIICKSSLLNDNKALLENDAITFSKMLCFTHVTCILPTFLLFPGSSPFSKMCFFFES